MVSFPLQVLEVVLVFCILHVPAPCLVTPLVSQYNWPKLAAEPKALIAAAAKSADFRLRTTLTRFRWVRRATDLDADIIDSSPAPTGARMGYPHTLRTRSPAVPRPFGRL